MKKIPTLFKRVYENHKVVDILDKNPRRSDLLLRSRSDYWTLAALGEIRS